MTQINLEEAATKLGDLVRRVGSGDDIILLDRGRPVARITSINGADSLGGGPRPQFGSGKGLLLYMAPDFDEPLDDFREYME